MPANNNNRRALTGASSRRQSMLPLDTSQVSATRTRCAILGGVWRLSSRSRCSIEASASQKRPAAHRAATARDAPPHNATNRDQLTYRTYSPPLSCLETRKQNPTRKSGTASLRSGVTSPRLTKGLGRDNATQSATYTRVIPPPKISFGYGSDPPYDV